MIRHLKGTIIEKGGKFVVLEVSGVGFQVYVTNDVLQGAREGALLTLWTHHAVREDTEDLFGFSDINDLSLFELLITVSGVGPKSALNILSVASAETLRRSITSNETAYLTKISGIGRKTAEKIVLELKEKLGASDGGTMLKEEVDTLEALKALGYSHQEARDALRATPKEITSTSDRVKHALQTLGKKR
ncbi:MAG: Holliday junction branch migration protein RuvA [Candidatus Taylorbacteria bacterium CG11_big_fil_rev_8_21_14_0_20_46_11]|uniref:Holliday junction branch migration complex subunit RuvA n=1 Tax=Candidatus Taylorbacteria bacterium CG11_big_fil_rev_8_21_14_0_20_46_11 TaxID=1975025 RepID=A0A2H0KA93_9BACT|nr:MAG: Holliday junction branch migration protein RuvA [Candidatus Taylorbacteria bacterium CG11_big_fil_rev_8_21_14_0_20_46_11]